MAAESPRKRLREEATCSICLDFFTNPAILDCGHNFCQACITESWGKAPTAAAAAACCPQCRETVQPGNLKPNRQLASLVEAIKQLRESEKQKAGGVDEKLCQKHREPLKLFCKDDGAPICVVCDRAKEHRGHRVVPVEEAAQERKDRICSCLETLRKERENIMACKADAEKESQDLLKQTESEKQKTVEEFRQLREFLEKQEKLLLTQLEEIEEEIAKKRDECMAELSRELSSLEKIIQEMEEKQQQPAGELLQDIRSTMHRYEERARFETPVAFPPALKFRIWDFCDLNSFLEGVMKQFKDTLVSELQLQKASVRLDPDTAHPQLILSEDCKGLRLGDKPQDVPKNPERFDLYTFVLGCQEFTASRHFWEVVLGSEEEWAVGVARKSVGRKGEFDVSPTDGIWAIGKWACNPPDLALSGELKRIQVSLNYPGRRVAFLDGDTASLLFTFSEASFAGETLRPFFYVYENGHLTLSP